MKLQSICSVVFALMLVVASSGYAKPSAGVLFQSGLYQEQVKGDLDAAIKVYERIIVNFPKNRPVVAKALLHIGLCYEKLGKQEAQKAYQRLIKEYTDQPEPVRIARRHLQQLDAGVPGAPVTGPTYRLVLDDETPEMEPLFRPANFDFSPSGDRLVFQGPDEDQDKLYIADETGTLIRPLLDDPGPWRWPSGPRWSPDGRLIAYRAWRRVTPHPDGKLVYAIFVISPDGGTPQQISPAFQSEVGGTIIRSFCWTADSQHLTYVVAHGSRKGVYTLGLDDNKSQSIPVKAHWSVELGGYSPDGCWLAFNVKNEDAKDNNLETDIWILATGGQLLRLTQAPGFDGHPTWARDGRGIYFVSARSGAWNIWRLTIDPETGLAKGQPQQLTFFSDARVMFPRALGDGGRIAFALSKMSSTIQVADASRPEEARTLVRGRAPQLSPDGKTIYYVGEGPGVEGIFAVPREGGKPRRLTQTGPLPTHKYLTNFDLSPDGQTLAYVTQLGEGSGLFTLPVRGGDPQLLLEIDGKQDMVPQWSPDGSQLAYADGNGLYIIPATGGKPHELAHLHGWDAWNVRWSPDGKSIAALGYPKPKSMNAVFVVPATGGELRQLTPDDVYKEGLEWHPDGRRLTYHVSLGKSETRQAYLDGRPPSLLVDHLNPPFWDYVGVWAPDGRRFFFVSFDVQGKGRSGIYVYDEASGDITLFSLDAAPPRWSRDEKTIVWTTQKEVRQIWVMENFLPESKAGE